MNVRCNHLVNNIRFYVNSMCTLRVLHDGHWITSGDSDLFPFQNNTLPAHGFAALASYQLFGQEGVTAAHIRDANNQKVFTIRIRPALESDPKNVWD